MSGKKRNQKDILLKVWGYIKTYRILVVLSILFAGIVVAFTLYLPILIGEAIDYIVEPGQVNFAIIKGILVKSAVIAVFTAILQWIMNTINNKITYQVIADIRKDVFERLQILPLKYMDGHPVGDVVSRVITDADQFADGLLMGFSQLFTGVVTILGTLIFMLSIHPGITLVVVCLTPLSLLVANYIAKNTFSLFKEQSVTRGEQTAYIDEMIGNQKIVQAFSREAVSLEVFDETLLHCRRKYIPRFPQKISG